MTNMKLYMQKRRHDNKLYALNKLGNKCARCSSINNLQFDHINRQFKSITIADMLSHSRSKLDQELLKCQLLCKDCHFEKTLIDMNWKNSRTEHGTARSYLHCKCEICRAKHREIIYAWRKKTSKH